jgi:hypothetical protein
MRHGLLLAAVAITGLGILAGCSQQAVNSSEAIQRAKTLATPEQQGNYLVNQMQGFVNSGDYQEAVKTAQYMLSSVDAHSHEAMGLLAQAKAKMAADAQAVTGDERKPSGARSTDVR